MLPMPSAQPELSSGAPLVIDRLDDVHDFAALGAQWNDLLRASRADSIFLTWEWLHAWWTHLRGDLTLHLIVVRAGGELIAVAPLARTRAGLPWLSRLQFLGTGYAGSDYLDVIVRRDREREGLHAIAGAIAASNLALHLDHLPPGSIASKLVDPARAEGWTSIETTAGTCPFIPLAGHTWDSYLARVGPAHRANFRRRLRSLDRQFEVRFAAVSSEEERKMVLDTLVQLHNQRWASRGGSTAFPTPACRAFHDDVTRRALACGRLRLFALRLDGAIVAATYCFAHNGRFYFYQGAFDERYRQQSIGMVAMGLTIRAAIEEGAIEFDMLYGIEPYKWLWARDARSLYRVELFPSDISGRLHRGTVTAERGVRKLARRMFQRRACNTNVPPAGAVC